MVIFIFLLSNLLQASVVDRLKKDEEYGPLYASLTTKRQKCLRRIAGLLIALTTGNGRKGFHVSSISVICSRLASGVP